MRPLRSTATLALFLAISGCSGGGRSGGGGASSTVAPIASTAPGSTTAPSSPTATTPTPVTAVVVPIPGAVPASPPAPTPPAPMPPASPAPKPPAPKPPTPPAPKPPTPPAPKPPVTPPAPTPGKVTKPKVVMDSTANKSSRGGVKIDTIVIHTTEGSYAGAISWFKNSKSQASSHYVIKEDGSEIRQMVPDSMKAWTQTYYNSRAIGIECAGYSSKASTWNPGMVKALHDLVAWLCQEHGVKVVHPAGNAYSFPGNRFNGTGLVAHGQIQPWNRSDPGPHFDWNALVKGVNARLGGAPAPAAPAPAATPAPKPAPAPASTSRPLIKNGSQGAAVKEAQQLLAKKGFSPGPIDGIFGPKTLNAVLGFQKAKGLVADGIVGPKTWTALLK